MTDHSELRGKIEKILYDMWECGITDACWDIMGLIEPDLDRIPVLEKHRSDAIDIIADLRRKLDYALKALKTIPCSCDYRQEREHRPTNVYCAKTYATAAAAEIEP